MLGLRPGPLRRAPRAGLLVLLALLAPVAVTRSAAAQSREDAARDRQARAEFVAGSEAYGRGEFEAAITHFAEAYRLSNRPQLLYNLGTSHDRLHHWREARNAFNAYLAQLPNATNRDEVRARLRVIDDEIAREEAAAEEARRQREHPTPVVVVREVPSQRVIVRTEPGRPFRVATYVSGGLALIAGGLSIALGVLTNDYYESLVASCGQRPGGCDQAVIDDVSLRAGLTNVALVATGVFAAGALVFLAVDLAQRSPAPAAAGAAPREGASEAPDAAPGPRATPAPGPASLRPRVPFVSVVPLVAPGRGDTLTGAALTFTGVF